ncbi:hypothetical protein TNCV_2101271 [Trichonephila clavipes]|nr:hypothetical protein TNCV_2101271 [Trichonephila clavipes]
MLVGRTPLLVFERGLLTSVRYRDKVLDPYICLFMNACGPEFILMDDKTRPHGLVVDEYLETRINKLGTQIFQSGNSAQNTAVRNANDQLLQSRFISGLRNDIRRFVLSRDPLNLEESINAALIEEQNMKLNQIASEERSGLSSAQTENPVLSALADRLQEINLRVSRLQEASSVTARKSGGNYFNRRENVFKCFYCGIQGHRQAECRKRQRDERAARYQPPETCRKRVFFFK